MGHVDVAVNTRVFSSWSARGARRAVRAGLICLLALASALDFPTGARAANQTWTGGGNDGLWSNGANWSGGAAPGAIVTLNNDVATFNGPVGTVSPILIDNQLNLASFLFDTADAGAYTFQHVSWDPNDPGLGYQGAGLFLTATATPAGNITMTSGVTNAQVFNTPIVFRLASSTNGAYSFVNDAASPNATFAFNGALINQSANTRPLTLTLGGSNTGNNTIREIYGGDSGGTRGAFIVNKTGAGTWIITGASSSWIQKTSNQVPAGVQVNDGILALQNGGALGSLTQGNIRVQGTGTLRLDAIDLANNGVTLNATGRLLANGNASVNAIAVGNTATDVTLATSNAADVFNVYGTITGGAASTIAHVAGPGQVVLNGVNTYVGAWSLDAGTTTLNSATGFGPETTAAVAFGPNSTARLQLNGNTVTLTRLNTNALAGTPVIENGGGGGANLILNTTVANTYAGTLRDGDGGGTLALTKNGTGSLTLALTAANTYSGGTSVNVGTLLANNTTGSATGTGPVAIANTATLGGSGTASGAVTVNAGGTISPGAAPGTIGTLRAGSLSLASGSKLNYDIAGTTSLDQIIVNNDGGLEINGGELTINGGSSPFTANGIYNLIGHTGAVAGAGVGALTVNPNNQNLGTNSYAFGDAGGFVTLTVASSGTPPTFWNADANGNWSTGPWTAGTPNAVGAFTALGGGGTPITADRTISVDGAYTVGTLSLNNPSFGYTLAPGAGASITLDNGASQAFVTDAAGSHTIQVPLVLTANGATFTASGASDALTVSGPVSGSGALTKTGAGTLALTGPNTYTGGTAINGGALAINSAASLGDTSGTVTFAGGGIRLLADVTDVHNYQVKELADAIIDTNGQTLTHSGTIVALSGATGGVVKNGAGTLALQGANAYVGQTTVNAGTLSINGNSSLGDPSTGAALNLGAGTTLTATTNTTLDAGGVSQRPVTVAAGGATVDLPADVELNISGVLTGGTVTKNGPGTLSVSNTANTTPFVLNAGMLNSAATTSGNGGFGTGAITLQGGATISASAMPTGNTLLFANALTVPTGQTGNINAPDRFNWTGPVTGGGTLNVNVISTQSRHDFNSDWTGFTGHLNIAGTGTARLFINGGDFDLASEWLNTAVDLGGSVTIAPVTNSTGNDIPIGALGGSSPTAVLGGGSAGSPRYTIGALNTNTTFAGQVTGNASITKTGTGTLTLTGANTYTGPTTVTGGTLVLGTTAQEPIFGGATVTTPAYADVRGGKIAFKYEGDASALVATVLGTLDAGYDQTPQFSDGPIRSTTLAAGRVLGWRDNAAASQVEVAYTLSGDANLDYVVDFNDLVALAQSYNVADGSRVWAQGDFTYDGNVDFNDLVALAQNYNSTLPAQAIPGASAAFQADLAAAFASVPEPTGLSALALLGYLLARRRRERAAG
ncbi:MAG TPA: autotransporter-associated beta strand repeat-containing protein [Tepidisphaeraceae bacterium]